MMKATLGEALRNVAVGLCVSAAVGCRSYVAINSDHYQPQFPAAQYSAYKGKAVTLRNVENVDEGTSMFEYYGPSTRYGGPLLTSYFWYCFRTAFERAGMRVYEDGAAAAADAPAITVKLVQVNEQRFTVGVAVAGGRRGPPLSKTFTVVGGPAAQRDAVVLEARAYRMIDALVANLLDDPDLRQALTGG